MKSSGGIALIHALEESIVPIRNAFREIWPDVGTFDLFDSSLANDRGHGASDAELYPRFERLLTHARIGGSAGPASGVLYTCSAFGSIIDKLRQSIDIPVLKPNEAAFGEALAVGQRVGLMVTFPPSADALSKEIKSAAAALQKPLELQTCVIPEALKALKSGDLTTHDELIARSCEALGSAVDVLVLGQFSMARARDEAIARTDVPILTTPHSAVRAMKALVQHRP